MNHALFHQPLPQDPRKETFEKLLKLFLDLLMKSGGNITEALRWLSYLDSRHHYTSSEYTLGDFIKDLKEQGYITQNPSPNQPVYVPSAKAQILIREKVWRRYSRAYAWEVLAITV
jgi:Ca-activated chloride channel family protein